MGKSHKGTWSKIFYGCNRVATALQVQPGLHVTKLRKILVNEGFTNSEISTVFDFLRHREVVTVDNDLWSLNGTVFNLR